jgi:NADH:ubiquinone oxidoreductase subunit
VTFLQQARGSCIDGAALDTRHPGWQNGPTAQITGFHATMKRFLLLFFTWWNGATFGTLLWTRRYGELVGEDEAGNRYYRSKGGAIDPSLLFERRWVIYNGVAEASAIPPAWHAWMHHIVDVPPTAETYRAREWEKPHLPNLTGTPFAYRPPGSTLNAGHRPQATGDYKAWVPGDRQ